MSRADVIRNAYLRYVRGEITLAQMLAAVRDWRPR